jgi:hypothetical protein
MIKDHFHCCRSVFSFNLGFKVFCALQFLGFSFHRQFTMNVDIEKTIYEWSDKRWGGISFICN